MDAEASVSRRRLPEAPIVPVAVPDPLLYLFGHPLAPDRTAAKRILSGSGFLQPLFYAIPGKNWHWKLTRLLSGSGFVHSLFTHSNTVRDPRLSLDFFPVK